MTNHQLIINLSFPINTVLKMRYIAAYLLLQIGGKAAPTAEDIKSVLGSVGIDADEERLSKLLSHPNIPIPPAINQVELNYWNPQPELLKVHASWF